MSKSYPLNSDVVERSALANILAEEERVWKKVSAGFDLTPEERLLIRLEDDSTFAMEVRRSARRKAAMGQSLNVEEAALIESEANPGYSLETLEQFRREDVAEANFRTAHERYPESNPVLRNKEYNRRRPRWRLIRNPRLASYHRILRRVDEELRALFLENVDTAILVKRGTLGFLQLRPRDLDDELPLLLIASEEEGETPFGQKVWRVAVEIAAVSQVGCIAEWLVYDSEEHRPKDEKRESTPITERQLTEIVGVKFPLTLPERTIRLALQHIKRMGNSALADKAEAAWKAAEDDPDERGVKVGRFLEKKATRTYEM